MQELTPAVLSLLDRQPIHEGENPMTMEHMKKIGCKRIQSIHAFLMQRSRISMANWMDCCNKRTHLSDPGGIGYQAEYDHELVKNTASQIHW